MAYNLVGPPTGSTTQVQYNNNGFMGASSSLTFDGTNLNLTGNFNITGGLTSPYVQMLPVSTVPIPVNQTASYIYTSGSTNDLYFTQYQPGTNFTNTTRLRWLESGLSTGLLYGGILSTVTGTNTFSIQSGSGIILTFNASTSSEPYPTIKYVTWPTYTSQSLFYSASAEITYIAIDDLGAISQTNAAFTSAQYKDRIILGRILHESGAVTNGAISTPTTAYAVSSNTQDFFRAFGPLKVSGHVLGASGSTLSLTKSAGDSYAEGRNYTSNPNQPNYVVAADDPAVTTSKIYYEYVSSSGVYVVDTSASNAGYTVIDNQNYVLNGVKTAVAAPDKSKFQIQRVYWFPKSTTRALFVYYGTALYASIADAIDGITSENFTEASNTRTSGIYVGSIIVNANCTSLTDTTTSKIVQGGISRGSSAGSSGGGTTTTPPGGANHQIQYNDAGVFNGSANLTFDTTTLELTGNLRISGNVNYDGGTLTGSIVQATTITGSTITGSNIFLAGDIAVNGGDITTTSTTFNLITGSATTVNFAQSANTLNIGKSGGSNVVSGLLSASDGLVVFGPSSGDIFTTKATASLFNTTASVINIGGAATNITIGSAAATGSTTLNTDIYLRTGNLIGAPGAGANVLSLISSGNVVVTLDTDNNAAGHKFIVQDSSKIERFSAGEDGNTFINPSSSGTGQAIWVSGSNTVGGTSYIDFLKVTNSSTGATTPSKTFRVTNSGAVEIVNSAYSTTIFTLDDVGNQSLFGGLSVGGVTAVGTTAERVNISSSASGTVTFDTAPNSIFYNSGPTANITANFTNVPTNTNRAITVTVILSQSATPRIISALQINGTGSTINWANKVTPTGNANQYDVFGFSLIRSGSTWITLGQTSTYG